MSVKSTIKVFVPPILYSIFHEFKSKEISFSGDYQSWSDASGYCSGYDHDKILDRVSSAMKKVIGGESKYERDSVLFDRLEPNWPLISILLLSALENNNELNLVDFGGSLGSSYYQNKEFMNNIDKVNWTIVEQENFVKEGRKVFQNSELKFSTTLSGQKADVILLSSVLQYLEDPLKVIDEVVDMSPKYIAVDRTPYLKKGGSKKIKVQKVSAEIYEASYPCHFFVESEIVEYFAKKSYEEISSYESLDRLDNSATWMGKIFRRIDIE